MTIQLKQNTTTQYHEHQSACRIRNCGRLASCGHRYGTSHGDSDNLTGLPSILAGELEVEAGTTVTVHDACDNDGLAEIRWDLHTAEGHAHDEEHEGEEHEGEEHEEEFILWSGSDWEKLETRAVEGTKSEEQFTFDVPLTSRGLWDLVVSMVDAEGNAADDVLLVVHIENDHLPLFELATVGGVNPAEWEGEEQVWAPGATVNVTGTVSDSDGVAEAELLLIRESDEAVVWSAEIPAAGEGAIDFSIDVVVPADAAEGEYHFEMEAVDATGVDMHTGFHLEVE